MYFGRVLTAMITPFDDGLQLNLPEARRLAKYLIDHGSDALVAGGTTGESPTLSDDEKMALFAAVKEAVGGERVIAGTGTNDTTKSVRLTREAARLGLAGVMLVVPYYNKPSQEGLYRHFRTCAAASEVPVMLYNVPSRTVANLSPETVVRLAADLPQVVALKEASGDMNQMSILAQAVPEGFQIYSGDDSLTLPMLSLGACGVVSVASHLVGELIQKMIATFNTGDPSQARQIHLGLMRMFRGLFLTTNPVPVKKAMELLGFSVGGLRLPLVEATAFETGQVKDLLEAYHLIREKDRGSK